MLPRFPLAFRPAGLRFLSRPVPPETSAFLTVGPPPALSGRRPPSGFPRSARARCDRSGRPLYPGAAVSSRTACISARRLPRLSGPPCTLLLHPTSRAFLHETSSKVHGCSPARSSPCLLPPGGTAALGLLPGAPHPAVTSDARPGGDGPSDTDPGLPCHRRHRRPPLQEHPLNTRDLVSHLHVESALRLDRQNPSARFIVPGQEGTFAFPPRQPPNPSETARLGGGGSQARHPIRPARGSSAPEWPPGRSVRSRNPRPAAAWRARRSGSGRPCPSARPYGTDRRTR